MKKLTRIFAAALTAFLLLAPNPVLGQSFYFWWQVVDELDRPYTGQTVRCSVYDLLAAHAAGQTEKILHFTSEMDSGSTMPLLSDSNGRLHFYSSVSGDVRVNCFSAYGGQGQARLSRAVHKIIIPRGFGPKVARFQVVTNTATTRTGLWLPVGTVIRDVLVQNVGKVGGRPVGEEEPHLNVGFIGDHTDAELNNHQKSALIHVLALNTDKDFIRPHVQVITVGGSAESAGAPMITGSHRGVALARFHSGSNIGTTSFNRGLYYEKAFVVNSPGGIEITYSTSSVAGISAHVYLMFESLHVGAFGSGISN